MIEWYAIFLVTTGDPLMEEHKFIPAPEELCREIAQRVEFLQEVELQFGGKPVPAKFEYCVWTQDGVIKDYVE